jgi:hypothetical protein
MKTKYHNWTTTKNSTRAKTKLEELQQTHPTVEFQLKTRKMPGRDKTSYSVRTITRKGKKRRTISG